MFVRSLHIIHGTNWSSQSCKITTGRSFQVNKITKLKNMWNWTRSASHSPFEGRMHNSMVRINCVNHWHTFILPFEEDWNGRDITQIFSIFHNAIKHWFIYFNFFFIIQYNLKEHPDQSPSPQNPRYPHFLYLCRPHKCTHRKLLLLGRGLQI